MGERSRAVSRFGEVDALKGVAILAVVLIHSIHPLEHANRSAIENWIADATR